MKGTAGKRCPSIVLLSAVVLVVGNLWGASPAFCGGGGPWPKSSQTAVTPLGHPTIEEKIARLGGVKGDYRFVVFGDQRALADGEWQQLVDHAARISRSDDALMFILDTGDIVDNGSYSDQFAALKEILRPVSHLPYLVGIGNHEKNDNKNPEALENTAAFLEYLDEEFSSSRMYYRKDIGSARFLFMDTSDMIYGDAGEGRGEGMVHGSRAGAQMEWLIDELADCADDPGGATILVMHHPIVQSSKKHRAQSAYLWGHSYAGKTVAEILLDGGVDLILTGHTHTYERFVISDQDRRTMQLVNISGRPRGGLMWLGPLGRLWGGGVTRRAADIAGREGDWLSSRGWEIPSGWSISQADAMRGDESDQIGIFTVEEDGGILLEMAFLDEEAPAGLRRTAAVRIK